LRSNDRKIRILLVEDESIIALDMRGRLEMMGFAVVAMAANGEDAFSLALQKLPDVILMDIKINGELDGVATAERIREVVDIPIIYVTAFADEQTLERAKVSQAFGYILKPIQEREVLISIEMATYKHRMEKRLRESQSLLSATLNSIASGVISLDPQGNVVSLNRAAERLIGIEPEAIEGKPFANYARFEESPLLSRLMTSPAVPVGALGARWAFLSAAGHSFPVDMVESVLKDDRGKELGTVLAINDLSETLDAMQQRDRFASILAESHDAVIVMDRDFAIRSWNNGAELMYGYSTQEMVGRSFLDLVPGDALKGELKAHVARAGADGEGTSHYESKRQCRSGKIVSVSYSLSPLGFLEGSNVEFASVERDISAEKDYEESLIAAKEAAEEASLAKSEFLSNMSHELRTPLNSIIGMTELSSELATTPEEREYLGIARQSADDLLFLINSILDHAKLEAGKMTVDATPFDPAAAAEDCVESVLVLAARKGVDLLVRTDPLLPERVLGDAHKFKQILLNLLSNAVKFTERGFVRVDVERAEGGLTIRVSDSGIGISPERTADIWDAFTQLDGSSTRAYGGTGLGLSIVQSLTALLRGAVSVASELGSGSVFTVFLPFSQVDEPLAVAATRKDRSVGLLLKREEERVILAERLESWGWPCVTFADEAALIAILGSADGGRYAAFFVDDRMVDNYFIGECALSDGCLDEVRSKVVILSDVLGRRDLEWRKLASWTTLLVRPLRKSALERALCDTEHDTVRPQPGQESKSAVAEVQEPEDAVSPLGSTPVESLSPGVESAFRTFFAFVDQGIPGRLRRLENEALRLREKLEGESSEALSRVVLKVLLAVRRGDEAGTEKILKSLRAMVGLANHGSE